MSNRIVSNSTFAVNNSLEQVVEISNASAIPVSEDADITKWGGVATSLGQKTSASSVPITIASDQSDLGIDLKSVNSISFSLGETTASSCLPVVLANDVNGDMNLAAVGDSPVVLGSTTSSASIPVVIASDQGTLDVTTTSANNSGAEGNLNNADSVASGDFSTEIDTRKARNITISGTTTDVSSNAIEIYTSHSSLGTKYKVSFDIYPDASGNFYEDLSGVALNYLYLKYTNSTSATVTASAIFN
jgi:hypothetical protein